MTFRINLKSSGRTFDSEGKETILRAGMRDGLNLAHNCMNGSCGECAAHLISGDVEQLRHHDYILSDQQKQRGDFLTCCYRAASDLELELHELHHVSEIPYQEIDVKVSKFELLQEDIIQLHLRSSRSKVLEFFAGQNVQLCLPDGSCLSLGIASCPCDGMNLRFHLRINEQNISENLIKQLKKGSKLKIKGPYGNLTLNEDSNRPVIFIAWESSFASIQSVIDHTISIDEDRKIALYWLSAIPNGHYLSNYCRSWRDILDNFCYESIDLQPAGEDTLNSTLERLVQQQGDLLDSDVYAVMPEAELILTRDFLIKLGLPEDQFIEEVF